VTVCFGGALSGVLPASGFHHISEVEVLLLRAALGYAPCQTQLPDTEPQIKLKIAQNMTRLGKLQPGWEASNKFLSAEQNAALAGD